MAQREIIYNKNKFSIAYDIVNPTKEDAIIILHGWGSNKEIMKQAFAKQMGELKHVYIDMPGFGKSANPIILTTDDYAHILQIFFDDIGIKPLMIAGHSFGGKVATLLNPQCLILLSSAGILVPKPFNVRAKIAIFKILKPLGVGKMRRFFASKDVTGMSHEMYETFKNVVNEDFSKQFEAFKNDALLFWGKNDTATPLWTARTINSIIKRSKLYPLDGDHYFFLKHPKFISDTITEYYKEHK
jgi:pimeloyl-ACP methyl ester carboxylesterase